MPVKFQFTRDSLTPRYREFVAQNDLLARLEAQLQPLGWTKEEILQSQLIMAVESNASLSARVKDLEQSVNLMASGKKVS